MMGVVCDLLYMYLHIYIHTHIHAHTYIHTYLKQIGPGDRLVSVDGLPVKGMQVTDIENAVSGAYGSQVSMLDCYSVALAYLLARVHIPLYDTLKCRLFYMWKACKTVSGGPCY
jgi:hypothetical protein